METKPPYLKSFSEKICAYSKDVFGFTYSEFKSIVEYDSIRIIVQF